MKKTKLIKEDKASLQFIYDRLLKVYKENPAITYMQNLKNIIHPKNPESDH